MSFIPAVPRASPPLRSNSPPRPGWRTSGGSTVSPRKSRGEPELGQKKVRLTSPAREMNPPDYNRPQAAAPGRGPEPSSRAAG